MTQIAAGVFKAKCLKILDEVNRTKEPVTITKRGKAVAQIVPIPTEVMSLYGIAKGTIRYDPEDDLFSTGEVWEADQ